LGAWCASGVIAPVAADWSSRIGAFAPVWWLGGLLVGALTLVAFARPSPRSVVPLWVPLVSVLPWLPVPLPAAAMLGIGPLGQILAAASGAAALVAAFAEQRRLVSAGAQPAAAMALLVLLFSASAWWVSPRIPGGDEPHYLIITQSLLADGDLRIEDNHRRRDYVAYADGELKPDYLRRGRDGAIYSIHAPGVSALVLPAFRLAGYRGAVFTVVVLSALGLIVVWRSAVAVTGGAGAAAIATAGVGLSVPFFFQAFTIYPDGPAAVAVAAVVWLALVRPGAPTWRSALACGALLGVLPWLHTRYGAIAGPLGLVVAGRLLWPHTHSVPWPSRMRALVAFAVPALLSVVAWLLMFQAIYGTWDPRAPYGHATDMRWARSPHGVAGLLLDQQFGVLPNAPIYLLALGGFAALWRRDRRLTAELLIVTVPYLTAVAGFHMWWAGRSSPARFLVPVLLPLALPLAAWWSGQRSRTARAGTVVLLAASLCLTATFVLVDHGALIYNSRDGHALWLLAAVSSVNLSFALPSLFQGGPAAAWLVTAAWLAAGGVGWIALRRVEGLSIGPWSAAVLGTSAMVAAGGASLGWALSNRAPWDRGNGLVAVTARACDPDALGARTSPPRVGRLSHLLTATLIPDASRRIAQDAAPRWTGTDLAPGRYRLTLASGLRVSGTVRIALGRPELMLMSCTLVDSAPGATPCEIALPGGASALWVSGDAGIARTVEHLALSMVEPGDPAVCGLRAQRAVVAPSGTLFVVGGRAWTEGTGLWTAGGDQVAVVADRSTSPVPLRIRQGNAAGAVNVRSGGWADRRDLGPGEVWDVDVPRRTDRVAVVTIETAAAFRPSDVDASSTDTRLLGAWVEPR
jgi:hypothetical protein